MILSQRETKIVTHMITVRKNIYYFNQYSCSGIITQAIANCVFQQCLDFLLYNCTHFMSVLHESTRQRENIIICPSALFRKCVEESAYIEIAQH